MQDLPVVKTMGDLAAAIGIVTLIVTIGLILAWIVFLFLWKLLNFIRPCRILGGRYAINEISDPPGEERQGIGDIVRSRIGDEVAFARRGARTFQDVDSPDVSLPSQVSPLPDQVKGLGPLINLLLRRDRFVVTVVALKPVRKEVALHVRLSRSTGKLLESRRFTEAVSETKDEAEAYSGAAIKAGCWLAFMLEKYARSRFANSRLEMLGTGSWLSYAWLCRGLHDPQPIGSGKRWANAIEDSKAWFNAALRVDHRNIGALIGLGQRMSLRFKVERKEMDAAIRHLKFALEQLERQRRLGMSKIFRLEYCGTCANSQWYQATYALVAAYTNYYEAFYDDSTCPCPILYLRESVRLGGQLAKATAATQLTLKSHWRKWAIKENHRKELQKVFRREDSDLASIVAISKARLEMQQNLDHKPDKPLPDWKPGDKPALWRVLRKIDPEHLDSLPPAQNLQMGRECGNTPGSHQICHLTPKARYNSACYYACVHNFEKALEELEHVFSHMSIEPRDVPDNYLSREWFIGWAQNDPTLKQLREEEKFKFEGIVSDAKNRIKSEIQQRGDSSQSAGRRDAA